MNNFEALRCVIREQHGCESRHLRSIPITEMFGDVVVFDGPVELFELIGHPMARRCYAFEYDEDDHPLRYFAILERPPVESALKAVQVAVAEGSRELF
jgi:hypothetical protein